MIWDFIKFITNHNPNPWKIHQTFLLTFVTGYKTDNLSQMLFLFYFLNKTQKKVQGEQFLSI